MCSIDPIDWGPIVGGILGVLAVIGAGAAGGVLLYQSSKNKLISTKPLTYVIYIDHKDTAS